MTGTMLALILPWLLLAVGAWIGWQLVRQNGRILLRLEAIEQRLPQPRSPSAPAVGESQALPVGTIAPGFELPDLSGMLRKLSEFRGKNVLLLFYNPSCGFCTKFAPNLAA